MNKQLLFGSMPLALALAAVAASPLAHGQDHLVISQVYGGGGGSNTSATYNTDYIELYNPTSSPIDVSKYSVQYASATGNFSAATSLTGSVPARGYFLISGSTGSGGPNLPLTPDVKGTLAISQSAGKVALVNGTTALGANVCSGTANNETILDEVSFGSTSCAEGTAVAALTINTAAIRNAAGNDTNNNAADFTTGTPNPHNSTSAGGSTTALAIASAVANPASVTAGNTTTLSVTVTPGSATTSVTVTVDLSSIGGSASQPLTQSGTANTYTYVASTASSLAAKGYTLPVTVTDQTNATASGSITLTVVAPVAVTPISTIQAKRSTYVGQTISTTGVITAVTNAGYYLQTQSSQPGLTGDEGIYVYSGSGKNPSGAVVGNVGTITGLLTLYPLPTGSAPSHTPSLEVTGASLQVTGTAALPTPVSITSLTPNGGIYQLTPYESMRVSFPSLTATGPTDANLTETTETYTSTGQFYAVITGTARPFREPGMDFRDFPAATCPSVDNCTAQTTTAGLQRPANLTLFDDNPERIIVESSLAGGTPLDVSTGARLTAPTGVIDFTYSSDSYEDPARILLDPGTFTPTSSNFMQGMSVVPVPAAGAGTFTVAAFNIERFFDPNSANDLYYDPTTGKTAKSSAVDVTQAAYQRRLQKISLAIRTVLNNPDIISLEEVENVGVAKDIAAQIDKDTTTGTAPHYVAYGTDSSTTFTDDIGGISVGFLVKSTVGVTSWQQIGNTTTFTNSSGSLETLNDRPSQVLRATVGRGDGIKPYPITVIANHLRSLSGINAASPDVRTKKELQAEMLATEIQKDQANGEHVIAVGDFNAFQFSDGYTDTLGTITGNVGNNVAVQPGKGGILNPPAVDLITTLPAKLQQTYVEYGNAQVLDHAVLTADIASDATMQVAHFDSDFPLVDGNDATTPARVSDHDAPVTYLTLPAPVTSGKLTGNAQFPPANVGVSTAGQQFSLTNTGETAITVSGLSVTGDFAQSNNCPTSLAVNTSCQINVVFTPTAGGQRTGTLSVAGSTSVAPVTLTGTGVAGTPNVVAVTSITAAPSGGYTVTVTMTNNGNGVANAVTLTGLTLGSATGSPLPQPVGSIQPQASAQVSVTVPASAGSPGATVAEKVSGSYTGGSFSGTYRAKLPTPSF